MAFDKINENPFSADFVSLSDLSFNSFNPRDYIDFSSNLKVNHEQLMALADVGGSTERGESIRRIMSGHVDRATGEVYTPMGKTEDVSCVKFNKGDILFHKYSGRIGRIGITDFEGEADNHFIIIKPHDADGHYLLLALRSLPVLLQLPYREVARPGVWNDDLAKLLIPRLGKIEDKIGDFIRELFELRHRAKTVLKELLESFDMAISSKMPTDYYFFMGVPTLFDETLDPGFYFIKAIEMMFPEHFILGNEVDIYQPPYLYAGDNETAITLSDYDLEGIVPQKMMKVKQLFPKNFVKPGNIILNRLHSSGEKKAKATVILPNITYLEKKGLSLNRSQSETQIPIYDQFFVLTLKPKSKISPYYLSIVLNSTLFQRIYGFMMTGSTGRQRIRKNKLVIVRLPTLSDHMMKAFSEATRISMEVLSETLRMLIEVHQLYRKVVNGEEKSERISELIIGENTNIENLKGSSMETAEKFSLEVTKLEYKIGHTTLT